ncbi:MAG: bifunctional phosphopantothenoylcysteine decarboxylase/phosphopantothenate--cysteine ligase CoaBC [Longimicrobiaceae bacterium]
MTAPAPRRPFAGRCVLLGVTGGIAAYKAVQLARLMAQAGARVETVLTPGALDFVRPLTFEALTGTRAHADPYLPGDPLRHVRLAREADVVVVAPATADFLARAAAGMADDLLSAVLLVSGAPVVLAPAMNDGMYEHPLTQANLERLRGIGYRIAGPAAGPLAWGEGEGPGRMLEPEKIAAHAGRALEGETPLSGRRVLVTAGPTREPLDPVRYLGNRSSGRMGYQLAAAAWRRGAEVTLISGPSALEPPEGVETVRVETAVEMRNAVATTLPDSDLLVMAAAVADFSPATAVREKIKKAAGPPEVRLEPTPDVLAETRSLRPAGCLVVGFALETGDAVEKGRAKLAAKGLDLLVVNDASEEGAGFETESNRVTLVAGSDEPELLPLLSKAEVADRVLDRVETLLPGQP